MSLEPELATRGGALGRAPGEPGAHMLGHLTALPAPESSTAHARVIRRAPHARLKRTTASAASTAVTHVFTGLQHPFPPCGQLPL